MRYVAYGVASIAVWLASIGGTVWAQDHFTDPAPPAPAEVMQNQIKAWCRIGMDGVIAPYMPCLNVERSVALGNGGYEIHWKKPFASTNYIMILQVLNTGDRAVMVGAAREFARVVVLNAERTGGDFDFIAIGPQ